MLTVKTTSREYSCAHILRICSEIIFTVSQTGSGGGAEALAYAGVNMQGGQYG